ncbi:hypothetical protein BJ170DRAFT_596472 [Xylariales sp. AK1849]|nr:hypothetical protein BJ170DRAFT_596472 [Xylariales sp. AK1849]
MEAQSPPKRMTRARAAAKAGSDSTTRTTKVVTASAKATITRPAPSMKRKTRPDDNENDEESHQPAEATTSTTATTDTMNKPARGRGRPRKVVDPEPGPEPAAPTEDAAPATTTTRAARGRGKKATTEAPKPEPVKTTRTRTRKVLADQDSADAPAEPVKKTTRSRATSSTASSAARAGIVCNEATTNPTPGLKSVVARPASRIGTVKKSVTFQEPEKENMIPADAVKAKTKATESATGMRAKPVRKAVTGTRATRASARTASTEDKKDRPTPLSPKKDGQNRPLSRASNSDDELATYEKTPLKPMMKSPVKPPNMKRLDVAASATNETNEGEEGTRQSDETSAASVFGSPARRPPSTPFKDMMKSPAKRVDGVPTLLFSSHKNNGETNQSPVKSSMLQSPAKRPQVPIMSLQAPSAERADQPRSPLKMSLLHSPAKRPMSPFKVLGTPVQPKEDKAAPSPEAKLSSAEEEQQMEETEELERAPEQAPEEPVEEKMETNGPDNDVEMSQDDDEEVALESPSQLEFPGRLSAVLPRHADPALQDRASPLKDVADRQPEPIIREEVELAAEADSTGIVEEDPMDIDHDQAEDDGPPSPEATPPRSAIRSTNPMFGLRQKDLVAFENCDSEDELALSGKGLSKFQDDTTLTFNAIPATPTPGASKTARSGLPSSAIKNAERVIRSVSRGSKLGFTPLARQLSDWRAGSPLKLGASETHGVSEQTGVEDMSLIGAEVLAAIDLSPAKGTFFEDAMRSGDMEAEGESAAEAAMVAALEADLAANFEDPVFHDIPITHEDVELAAEADEMSLLEPEQVEEMQDIQAYDDSISEASQEYGDENAVPIDPAILGPNAGRPRHSMAAIPPVTPMRPSTARIFNTTTKVPLKPADDSSPKSMKRRSASVSRLPVKRPAGLSRNATVISYSPTKEPSRANCMDQDEQETEQPPVTPAKSDIWSSIGTPARTPRRDLNTALLRGAIVFVDVHTSEGADASTVFVELLTQMGARCVKSWPWNPSSPNNGESATAKIGITHVVYKDGGKRTMEKVRESGGVVQCVGVGWVLDCERENEWLDEAPYYIDTSLVPRGGARRRKSMEPKALANLNGTLITPMKQTSGPARDCQTVPNNHMSRRDSTIWMRSPSNADEDEDMDADGEEWSEMGMLTPVPKTPAPEAIHRYVSEMDITPATPTAEWTTDLSPEQEQMLMRTAPPKQSMYADLGEGLLSQNKDQNVMMRLMAARRKSLQFAPKIASPLSKAWN